MPAHYLLTFLGTGQYEQNGNARRYRTAKYVLPDGSEYESPFVAEALWSSGEYDGIVLVGTMGSMWEEAYLRFASDAADDAVATQLYERSAAATAETAITVDWCPPLEQVLPGESHIVLIEYGMTPNSLARNVELLSHALQVLPKGAELTLDITHGFRSMPLVFTAAIQAASVRKDAPYHLRHVRYGMIETIRSHGHATVVALDTVINLEAAGRAAYIAQTYGRFGEFGNLLGSAHPLYRPLMAMEEALAMYRVDEAVAAILSVEATLRENTEPRLEPLRYVLDKLLHGTDKESSPGQIQFALAQWFDLQHNYAAAVIFLVEAIVTRQAEHMQLPNSIDKSFRQRAIDRLKAELKSPAGRRYKALQPIRNSVAHASLEANRQPHTDIAYIHESIQALPAFFAA